MVQETPLGREQTCCIAAAVFGPQGSQSILYTSPLQLGKLTEYSHQQSKTLRVFNMQHHPIALSISTSGEVVAFADASGAVALMQRTTGELVVLEGDAARCCIPMAVFGATVMLLVELAVLCETPYVN